MKKAMILPVMVLTLTSIAMNARTVYNSSPASIELARGVIAALQQKSADRYQDLFPTLNDFYSLMEKSNAYGDNLQEAKKEFSVRYKRDVIPALRNSFESLIAEGEKQGINWSKVEFVQVELSEGEAYTLTPLKIVFSFEGAEHIIQIDNAFVLDGQWKVSQYAALK